MNVKFSIIQLKAVKKAIYSAHKYIDDRTVLHLTKLTDEVTDILSSPPKPTWEQIRHKQIVDNLESLIANSTMMQVPERFQSTLDDIQNRYCHGGG